MTFGNCQVNRLAPSLLLGLGLIIVSMDCEGLAQSPGANGVPRIQAEEQTAVQTLPAMVAHARQVRPVLAAARSRRQAAAQTVRERRGGLLPQVSFEAGGGYQYADTPSTRLRPDVGSNHVSRWDVGLRGRQLLFDNFATASSVRAAKELVQAEEFVVEDTVEQLSLQVMTAFVNVLQAREAVDRAQANVAAHRRIYGLVSRLVDNGRARRSDLAQVDARLAFAESEVIRLAGERAEAESIYFEVIGLRPTTLANPLVEARLIPLSIDAAVDAALSQHPRLMAAERQELAAAADVDAARGPMLPEVALEVSATSGQNLNAVDGNNTDVQAQLRLNYDLYTGGADDARLRRAKALSSAALLDRLEVDREIREQVRIAFDRLTASQRRIGPLRRQASTNEQVVATYEQQFEVGLRTLFDLLDAQQDLFVSEVALVTARYNEIFGGYFLLSAMGMLGEGLGLSSAQVTAYCGPGNNGPFMPRAQGHTDPCTGRP